MKVAFIIKSTIKKKDLFLKGFQSEIPLHKSLQITFYETQRAKHAIELAQQAATEFDAIIAVGGDGTLSEVLNGVMNARDTSPEIYKNPILGLFPSGTANDFARSINARRNLSNLFESIENDQNQQIDVGKVHFVNLDGKAEHRYFMNIADIGLGGYVVKKVNESSKFLGPKLTFLKTITISMITYTKASVRCFSPSGEVYRGKTMSLIAANGRFFGSGLCIAPNAKLDDGQLELVILGDISMKDYILNIGKVKKGKIIQHPKISYSQTNELSVEHLDDQPAPLDVDGEFVGYTPLTFSIVPAAIRFLNTRAR